MYVQWREEKEKERKREGERKREEEREGEREMAFTKEHFQLIAKLLRETLESEQLSITERVQIAQNWAKGLKETNPLFTVDKFIKAVVTDE